MQKNLKQLRDAGIEPVAISYDGLPSLKKAGRLSFTLLSDPRSEVIDAYGVRDPRTKKGTRYYGHAYPVTSAIGRNGKVVSIRIGETQERHSINDLIRAVQESGR